jgi:hypothetical protein
MEIVIVHLFATIMKEVIMFETRHPGIRDLYEKGIQFFRNKGEKPRALVDRMNALGLPLEAMAAQESNPLYGFFEEIKAIIFRIFSTEYNSMCSLQSGDIARRSYFGEIFGTQ